MPQLELKHGGLESALKKFESGLNRLTLGLVISASLIAASLILNSSKTFITFEFEWFGIHRLSVTEALGVSGYIVATFLGLWLVFSIIRSGKL
jgi:ubiquinone biosynthesis protein